MTGALPCGSSSYGLQLQSAFDFGKYRGRYIDQIDDGYLEWIVNNFPDSDLCGKAADTSLTSRGKIIQQQRQRPTKINVHDFISDLKSCTRKRDLQKGRRVHANAVEAGIDSNLYVAAALTNMYAKCDSMEDARTVFYSIQKPDVVCWNALILGYADNGQGLVALKMFYRMKEDGKCTPNSLTYLVALKACTSLAADEGGKAECLERGREIHSAIGFHMDQLVQSTLINLYAKCGRMDDAITVFDSIQKPDVVCWNALLLGYADNGQGLVALDLFSRMKVEGICTPNSLTFIAALKACTSLAAEGEAGKTVCLERGRQIHSDIGCHMNTFVQNTLINMYAKCGSMIDARTLFTSIQEPDVVSWNALILGYADNRQGLVALDLFARMKNERRHAPNSLTYLATLKACTSLAADGDEAGKAECLQRGRQIHSNIGNHMDNLVQSMLINMYAKSGSMEDAMALFDSIKEPDVVCWNALILGYAENGQELVALQLFSRMRDERRCAPDSLTYLAALKACLRASEAGKSECLETVRQIHSEVGCHMDHLVQSTLINLYARCGSMEEARTVFESIEEPDVVCWNTVILGYAENGQGLVALHLFSRMKDEGRCTTDSLTYLAALKACTSLIVDGGEAGKTECLERGRKIHLEIGLNMNHFVQSTLINLYAKCGSMEDARTVFDSIQKPDLVCLNALILGYVENGQGLVSLDLFSRMKNDGRNVPNSLTYVAALMACCSIGALAIGQKIHSVIRDYDSKVVTCLVDFYSKCGSLEESRAVFDFHPRSRDLSTWNALLAGYARFGDTRSVFNLFEAMQDEGFQPDAVTFVCVLSCCSHAGLIAKAWEYLDVMPKRYGITPTVMHYSCMIDLLGRANKLDEAVLLLHKMPCKPDGVTWMTLLGACRKWKNVKIGRWAFMSMDLDQKIAPAYVLMAEIYGSRGMWEEQERVLEEFGDHRTLVTFPLTKQLHRLPVY